MNTETRVVPATESVRRIRRAKKKVDNAELELSNELYAGRSNGLSYRALADAADLAHETVRTILARRELAPVADRGTA